MRRILILLLAAAGASVAVAPSPAGAAVCKDYADQAAAQRAADTVDADHDGVYCEGLPCPCLKPGAAGGPSRPAAGRHRRQAFRLGATIRLGPRTRTHDCAVRGPLPDPRCTPGAVYEHATRPRVCDPGYSAMVRDVSDTVRDRVYAEYGIGRHRASTYEIDHLVPLELGGSNSIANLFPEAASPAPGYHEKDRVEDRAHARVCGGARTLRSTQRSIAEDWTVLYRAYVLPRA
ncbi:hypothetical protein FSW04_13540 [Baekduia soli]|uniref:HNH endonuclease n=1 Tax=Baekduia soli TaxID=496014 RepID=A0A5B8U6M4_9ACTN|nr:hypothetical protein [Baekduia soli]QEC48488.1 hypothetical protein FSW04_13540 [Baekduia soli]